MRQYVCYLVVWVDMSLHCSWGMCGCNIFVWHLAARERHSLLPGAVEEEAGPLHRGPQPVSHIPTCPARFFQNSLQHADIMHPKSSKCQRNWATWSAKRKGTNGGSLFLYFNPGLVNHGYWVGRDSPNSGDQILKWHRPIKQPEGFESLVDIARDSFQNMCYRR